MEATSLSEFPFLKLKYFKYLTLDIMMNIDYQIVLKFMFTLNKEARSFLQQNFITIRNEFVNDGLLTYSFKSDENHFFHNL